MEQQPQNIPSPEDRSKAPVPQWAQAVDTQRELQLLQDTIARSKGLQ